MKDKVLNKKSLERIKNIHKLSKLYNRKLKNNHKLRILELMKEHIAEIRRLYKKKNKHYLIESGDLTILCFEFLLENKMSIDEILLKCLERYESKLPRLIKEA